MMDNWYHPLAIGQPLPTLPIWLKEKLFQKIVLKRHLESVGLGVGLETKLLFTEHHQSHAASAFFPSPFAEAAVLTMDGVGEWATTSIFGGSKRSCPARVSCCAQK